MIEKVLLATDGSPAAKAATEHAIALADVHGASVSVVSVAETGYPPSGPEFPTEAYYDMVDKRADAARQLADQVVATAEARGVQATDHVDRERSATEAILRRAEDDAPDLIVMGSQGRGGLERFLLGSVAEAVLRGSPVPVLVLREPKAEDAPAHVPPYQRIMVPTDGSTGWKRSMETALALAKVHASEVVPLYVVDGSLPMSAATANVHWGDLLASIQAFGRSVLEEAKAMGEEAGVTVTPALTESGSIHKAILNAADKHEADLVLLATHARTGLARFLLGSVTERVLRTGTVPVMSLHLEDQRTGGS